MQKVTERTAGSEKSVRYAGDDEPVFRSRKSKNGHGGHLEVSQVNNIVAKAVKDAGMDRPVSPH